VAFFSYASNLVAGDTNGTYDVFVRDRKAQVTRRISVGPGGQQAHSISAFPAISAHGRYVAFFSSASNLVAGDSNGAEDVFVRDRLAQVTRRVSVG
jgi:Tol biopolymer transport system component